MYIATVNTLCVSPCGHAWKLCLHVVLLGQRYALTIILKAFALISYKVPWVMMLVFMDEYLSIWLRENYFLVIEKEDLDANTTVSKWSGIYSINMIRCQPSPPHPPKRGGRARERDIEEEEATMNLLFFCAVIRGTLFFKAVENGPPKNRNELRRWRWTGALALYLVFRNGAYMKVTYTSKRKLIALNQ